jgi:hypothetical protein
MFELLVTLTVVAATAISPATPASSLDEADKEIERAARDYRIQVYDAFHRNRPEYDSRSEAGYRVLSGSRRSGRRPEDGEALTVWCSEARTASIPGQLRALPDLPDFAAEGAADPNVAVRPAENASVDQRNESSNVAVVPGANLAGASSRSIETTFAGKVGAVMLRAAMTTPYGSAPEPLPELHIEVGSPIDSNELTADKDIEPVPVAARDLVLESPEKIVDVVAHGPDQPVTNELAAAPVPARPNTPEAAAPLATPTTPAESAPAPDQPADSTSMSTAPSAAAERLTARVTSFNESMDDLVAEMQVDGPARLFDVARLLNDLVHLSEDRTEIASQLETLSPSERHAVPQLQPLEPAATSLQATIAKTRTELDTGTFFGSDTERQQALELLDVLEKQLHALSNDS